MMSQIQIQKDLTIAQVLRICKTKYRQIRRNYTDNLDGRCAVGAVMNYMTGDDQFIFHYGIGSYIKDHFAIDEHEIIRLNDSGKTFDEIADWLENRSS